MDYVSNVIEGVARSLCNSELSHTKCTSTIRKMISEKNVTSSIHAIEAKLISGKVNLAWEATSLNGKHINEVHVSTDWHFSSR